MKWQKGKPRYEGYYWIVIEKYGGGYSKPWVERVWPDLDARFGWDAHMHIGPLEPPEPPAKER